MPRLSDLLLHRRWIFRHIKQFLVVCLCLSLTIYIAQSGLSSSWRLPLAITMMVATLFFLLRSEMRAMGASYGLTVLPPGWGSLGPRQLDGAGRLLSLLELGSRFRWKPGGILMGRPLPHHQIFGLFQHVWVGPPDDRHMLTIAGSRGGKGVSALVPNLLLYPGSALVIDPKGELAQITAARRGHGSDRVTECLGQDVYILDPEDIVIGYPRASWNPRR